ncbi:tetratricopeptide repeat protein [Desulfosporosinus sp. SB140]|uniref:tetratricopeptide repeat protein n=1 Tax=Desulfosporosinus paludis TaxID=3115649 RepID=UPI003890DB40
MRPVLSICMMVKNEEKNIERCLQSLQPLMQVISSELIIVDTGSSDRTVEIANQFTDKVLFHMWNNNFSEMRNITISYATGQWVLIIDADEEIETADALISFIKACPDSRIGSATILVKNITNGLSGYYTTSVSPRLFRRNKHFYYRGVVHNEPFFQGGIAHLESSIIHYGYIANDKELMEGKFQRTSTLLQAELEKNPENIYYRYQLSISYSMHGDWPEALQELLKIYENHKDEDDEFWRRNLYVIAGLLQACAVNGHSNDEIIQFGLRGIELEPEYVDLYFFLAQLYEMQENFEDAFDHYFKHEKLITNFSKLNISHNMALQHYTLSLHTADYYNMGVISFRKGNYGQARQYLQQVLAIAAEDDLFIKQAHTVILGLDFVDKKFDDTRMIYDSLLQRKLDQELVEIEVEIEKFLKNLNGEERHRFYLRFQDLPNLYGKLNGLRLYNGDIGDIEWESLISAINNTDMNKLPDYYAPVLAYSIKYCPQEAWKISACLSEKTIVSYMCYLDEVGKMEFVAICRDFICVATDSTVNSYEMVRLQKNAAKYILFSGALDNAEYPLVFANYVEKGTSFLKGLYSEMIFTRDWVYDLKNVEENFLFYITLAKKAKSNPKQYILFLKKALREYPEMHKGVDILLQSVQTNDTSAEMQHLLEDLIINVDTLIASGLYNEALNIITECENFIGGDQRLLAKKAEIGKLNLDLKTD